MALKKRQKLIITNAVNILVELNEVMVRSRKKGETPRIKLPSALDRAFAIYHEAGVIPFEEVVSEGVETL
jgi:hypothetical protein